MIQTFVKVIPVLSDFVIVIQTFVIPVLSDFVIQTCLLFSDFMTSEILEMEE